MTYFKMQKLNLHINDHEGITLLSPFVQDAIVPRTLIEFDSNNNLFHMQMNRFCWEHPKKKIDGQDVHHRIHSHFMMHAVESVQQEGFHHKSKGRHLNLLALDSEDKNDLHYVYFIFSDHRMIRVCAKNHVHCRIWDFNDHWHTHIKPKHLFEYVH